MRGQKTTSPLLTGTLPSALLGLEIVIDHALDHVQHPALLPHFLYNTGVVDVPLTLSLAVLALEGVSFTDERSNNG